MIYTGSNLSMKETQVGLKSFGILFVLFAVAPTQASMKTCIFVSGDDAVIGAKVQVDVTEASFEIWSAPGYEEAQTAYPFAGVKGNVLTYAGPDAVATGDGYVIRVKRDLLAIGGAGEIAVRLDNGIEGYVDTVYRCQ